MKKVIIKQQTDTIDIEEVKDETPDMTRACIEAGYELYIED